MHIYTGCFSKVQKYFSFVSHRRHNPYWFYHSPALEDHLVNLSVLVHSQPAKHSPMGSFVISLRLNSTTLLWFFRWSTTTKQLIVSVIWRSFYGWAKIFCQEYSIYLGIFNPPICFFTAALIPSIETRHQYAASRQWPLWLSHFLQGRKEQTERRCLFLENVIQCGCWYPLHAANSQGF